MLTVMKRYCLLFLLFVFLCKDVKAHETNVVSPLMEVYWNSNLPNTSMPKVIRDLIHPVKEDQRFVWDKYTIVWTKDISNDVMKIFFRPKDIFPGAKIKNPINLGKSVVGNRFLSRIEAEAIPFAFDKLPQILNHYSISSGTKEAKQIEESIQDCETPAPKGSEKFCVTSLESMIDNVISQLGTRNIQVLSTKFLVDNREAEGEKVSYKVASNAKELPKEKLVLCHPLPVPHTVFYCHTAAAFEGYSIALEGINGTKVNALAVCHSDTENFNLDLFEKLNWNPNTKPICHFLMEDHLIWAPR